MDTKTKSEQQQVIEAIEDLVQQACLAGIKKADLLRWVQNGADGTYSS
jgi:hypothetical protein